MRALSAWLGATELQTPRQTFCLGSAAASRDQRESEWNCGNAGLMKTHLSGAFSSFGFLVVPAIRWIPKLDVASSPTKWLMSPLLTLADSFCASGYGRSNEQPTVIGFKPAICPSPRHSRLKRGPSRPFVRRDRRSRDNSLRTLDNAVEIARHFGAAVALVHAVPLMVQFGDVPIPIDLYEEQKKAAKAKLGEIAGQKLGGVEHESVVYTGDAVGSILQSRNLSPTCR